MTHSRRSEHMRTAFRVAAGAVALTTCTHAGSAEQNANVGSRDNAAARFDYLLHCSGCHRTDGAGAAPDVPSLRGVGSLLATPEGREYIVRVPEVAQSPLDDEALARLLNWVLREFNADTLPTRFRPFDGSEVGAARTRTLADPIRARAAIVGTYALRSTREEKQSEPSPRDGE